MEPNLDDHQSWQPNKDLFVAKSGDLVIKIDLSGVVSQDLDITTEGKDLRVKGKRHDPELGEAQVALARGIPSGPFEFRVEIPPGFNVAAAQAAYLHGVLRVVVPPLGTGKPPASITGSRN